MKSLCLGLLVACTLLCAVQEASAFGFFRPRNNVTIINNTPAFAAVGVGGCGVQNLGVANVGYGVPFGGVNVNVGRVGFNGFNRFGGVGVGRIGGGVRVAAPGVRVRVR